MGKNKKFSVNRVGKIKMNISTPVENFRRKNPAFGSLHINRQGRTYLEELLYYNKKFPGIMEFWRKGCESVPDAMVLDRIFISSHNRNKNNFLSIGVRSNIAGKNNYAGINFKLTDVHKNKKNFLAELEQTIKELSDSLIVDTIRKLSRKGYLSKNVGKILKDTQNAEIAKEMILRYIRLDNYVNRKISSNFI